MDDWYRYDEKREVFLIPPAPNTWNGPCLQEYAENVDPGHRARVEALLGTVACMTVAPPTLRGRPTVAADASQLRLANEAMARAAACGLDLPIVLLRVVEADQAHPRASCREVFPGIVRIIIRADNPLQEWPHLLLHELQHAADFNRGIAKGLSAVDLEARAVHFEWNASEGWP